MKRTVNLSHSVFILGPSVSRIELGWLESKLWTRPDTEQRCILTCTDPGGAQMVRCVELRIVESCEQKCTLGLM